MRNEIYQILKPLIFLERFLCIFPVKIKRSKSHWSLSWSHWYTFFSFLVALGIVSLSFLGTFLNVTIEEIRDIRLNSFAGRLVTYLDTAFSMLTFMLGICKAPFTYHSLCNFINCLNKADAVLFYHPSRKEKRTCFILFASCFVITSTVLLLDLWTWCDIIVNKNNIPLFIINQIPFYFYIIFVVGFSLNFCFLVRLINARLTYLNQILVKEYKSNVDCFPNGLTHINILNRDIVRRTINKNKVYELLFEATSALNEAVGFNILVITLGCFVHLMVTPYDLYLEILQQKYNFIFLQIYWMIGHILRLLLIVEPCQRTMTEVKKLGATVSCLVASQIHQDFRSKMDILLIQLTHSPIKLTAFDFMVIDRSLLTTIAGGVTTYLVILFQFHGN